MARVILGKFKGFDCDIINWTGQHLEVIISGFKHVKLPSKWVLLSLNEATYLRLEYNTVELLFNYMMQEKGNGYIITEK